MSLSTFSCEHLLAFMHVSSSETQGQWNSTSSERCGLVAIEWAWGLPLAASQVAGSRNALQGCTRSVGFVSWGSSDQIVWKNEK